MLHQKNLLKNLSLGGQPFLDEVDTNDVSVKSKANIESAFNESGRDEVDAIEAAGGCFATI